jgi:hypothetical protein
MPGRAGLLLVLLSALPAAADVVTTTDGKTLEGKVTSQDAEQVVIETTFDGTKTVPRAQVKSVDTSTPPLREQLEFRAEQAKDDVAKLWDLHKWMHEKGFKEDLRHVLDRIVELKPDDVRARKLLGHEKVDGTWMTPEQKAEHLKAKEEAALRAKGLVPYQGRWVTPEEKDALEKGMIRDGKDWVTEEEYHRRRGEQKVGGQWVRVGEKEGKDWSLEAAAGARVTLGYAWGPHFDVAYDVEADLAKKVLDACEAAYGAMRGALSPKDKDLPEVLGERLKVALFKKAPAYARFATWFGEKEKCDELVPGWARAVQKQHSFWWTHPERLTAVYQFPNTDKTFVSNAVHNVGLVLLTRYRLNYQFPPVWLREGFAYHLEMETLKYSQSYTLGRGGGTGGAPSGETPPWADSDKWRASLAALVAEGRDPPLKRLAAMTNDQMGYPELVKSWSLVECLVRWDAAKFKAFVDASKKDGAVEEDALRAAYGVGYRELDVKWRAYVTAGFKHV